MPGATALLHGPLVQQPDGAKGENAPFPLSLCLRVPILLSPCSLSSDLWEQAHVQAGSQLLPAQFHIHRRMSAAPEEPQLLQTQQYLPGIEKLDITTPSSSADLSFCYHLCLIIMQFLAGSWLS